MMDSVKRKKSSSNKLKSEQQHNYEIKALLLFLKGKFVFKNVVIHGAVCVTYVCAITSSSRNAIECQDLWRWGSRWGPRGLLPWR